jgi:hypothetical protein
VSVTRLTGLEASALRYADCLPDDALADRLVDLGHHAAGGYASAHDLRELAACALIIVRRFDEAERGDRRGLRAAAGGGWGARGSTEPRH